MRTNPAHGIVLALAAGAALAVAGPLTPPGPPTPTNKTLQQVEPRTPLDAVPGDAANAHRITQPGSYYLTRDVIPLAAGQNGVIIEVSHVTLDLNGFTIDGAGIGGEGAFIDFGVTDVTIRNGRVRDWVFGGVVAIHITSNNVVIEDIVSTGNGLEGMRAQGAQSVIRRCLAEGNSTGIAVGGPAIIDACSAHRNFGAGIVGDDAVVLRDCLTTENGLDQPAAAPRTALGNAGLARRVAAGLDPAALRAPGPGCDLGAGSVVTNSHSRLNLGDGFVLGPNSTIEASTAFDNVGNGLTVGDDGVIRGVAAAGNSGRGLSGASGQIITDSTFTRSGTNGVWVDFGSRISNCAITATHLSGVSIGSSCAVEGNIIRENGLFSANAAGVLLRDGGTSNRVDGNHLIGNPWGVRTEIGGTSTHNLVLRNTVRLTLGAQQISLPGNITAIATTNDPTTIATYANLIQ